MIDKSTLLIVYAQQADLVQAHVSDFTDADMLVRPVENANHAAWQLGHLATSTTALVNMAMPGALPELPADFVERHGTAGARLNGGFGSKDDLINRFCDVNDAMIDWLKKLTPEDAARSTPAKMKGFADTIGHLAQMHPVHVMMHLGQIQVIRRKLGKPVLF
jgi:hypothetical protein